MKDPIELQNQPHHHAAPPPQPGHEPDEHAGKAFPAEAKGVFQRILRSVKKFGGKNLNAAVSALNPLLDENAETAAKKVTSKLPSDHFIRSKLGGSLLGIVSGLIEQEADEQDEPMRTALLTGSHWIAAFSRALHGHSGKEDKKGTSAEKAESAFKEFHKTLAADWRKRANEAKTDKEKRQVLKATKEDALAWHEILNNLLEGEITEAETKKAYPWAKKLAALRKTCWSWTEERLAEVETEHVRLNKALAKMAKGMEAKRKTRLATQQCPDKGSWATRALNMPWKLFRKVIIG